jgi:hypothetical protein
MTACNILSDLRGAASGAGDLLPGVENAYPTRLDWLIEPCLGWHINKTK